ARRWVNHEVDLAGFPEPGAAALERLPLPVGAAVTVTTGAFLPGWGGGAARPSGARRGPDHRGLCWVGGGGGMRPPRRGPTVRSPRPARRTRPPTVGAPASLESRRSPTIPGTGSRARR